MSSILDKIRALRAKTTAAGCTEAEALAAAELASRLIAAHQVSEEALGTPSADPITSIFGERYAETSGLLGSEIARFCQVKTIILADGTLRTYGQACDIELAEWLREMLHHAFEREFLDYLKTPAAVRDKARIGLERRYGFALFRASFMYGISQRVQTRLREIRLAREALIPKGRALVLNKTALATNAFAQDYPSVRNLPGSRSTIDSGIAAAGSARGDSVSLGRPIAPGQGPLRLGRS